MNDLRQFSPLTWILERLFFALQYLSPANLLCGTRVQSQDQFSDPEAMRAETIRRGRCIEACIVVWLALEIVAAVVGTRSAGWIWWFAVAVPAFRVFDVTQAAINMNIFDRLRIRRVRTHYVATLARTVVLSLWNFLELIVCFGVIYSANLCSLANATSPLDAYYFSAITQLTVGYGDIQPLSWLRPIAAVQGILGVIFALVVLSRLIAFLPRTEPVASDQ